MLRVKEIGQTNCVNHFSIEDLIKEQLGNEKRVSAEIQLHYPLWASLRFELNLPLDNKLQKRFRMDEDG